MARREVALSSCEEVVVMVEVCWQAETAVVVKRALVRALSHHVTALCPYSHVVPQPVLLNSALQYSRLPR